MMMLAKYPLPHNPLILLWDRQDTQKLSLVTLPPFVGVQVRLTIVSALGSLKSSPDPSPPGNRATLLSVGRLLGSTSGRQKFDDFYFPFIALWPPCSPVTRSVLGLRGGESKYERETDNFHERRGERGLTGAGGYFKFNVPCFCHYPHNPAPTGRQRQRESKMFRVNH